MKSAFGARRVAFFDLDKTVLATSATLALTGPLLRSGLMSRMDLARGFQAQLSYHLLDASHERSERVKDSLSAMVAGWPVSKFETVINEALHSEIEPIVYREALDAISAHQAAGHAVIISSASAEAIVSPIMRMLGANGMIATVLEERDGAYTGNIAHYNYGEAKAVAARSLAARHGWDLAESWAYSDSVTDEPLLRVVGNPVAVNPNRSLARIARDEGWQIRRFDHPVRLEDRVSSPLAVAVALATIGAIGALAFVLWRRKAS